MGGVQQFTVRSGAPEAEVDFGSSGGTITVTGGTVYYRDEPVVTAATADGSIASGSSATLYGTQFFSTTAARADAGVVLSSLVDSRSPLVRTVDGNIIGNRVTSVPTGSRVALEVAYNVVDPDVTIMQHLVGFSFYTGTPGGSAGTLQGGSCESSAFASPANMGTVLGFEGVGRAGSDAGKTVSLVLGLQGTAGVSGTAVVPLLVAVRAAAPAATSGAPTVTEARSLDVQEPTVGTTRRSIYSVGAAHFRKGTATNALEIADASDVLQWASTGSVLTGYASDGVSSRIVLDPGGTATSRLSMSFFNGATAGIVVNDFGGAGTGNLIDLQKSGATKFAVLSDGSVSMSATTTATAPSAGGAGALPATPLGYLTVTLNGTQRKVAYY